MSNGERAFMYGSIKINRKKPNDKEQKDLNPHKANKIAQKPNDTGRC